MTHKALNEIRTKAGEGNLSASCTRGGCRVDLSDIPPKRLIVDMDKACPISTMSGKRCDYVLFMVNYDGAMVTVPIELKRGDVHASEASEQLQQGATYAEKLVPEGSKPTCHLILFHGGRIHPNQRKVLNRSKVRFLNRPLTIKTARCGRPKNLAHALK